MLIGVVIGISLGQPRDMPLPTVEKPCYGVVRSKNALTLSTIEVVLLVAIETKYFAIKYIHIHQ